LRERGFYPHRGPRGGVKVCITDKRGKIENPEMVVTITAVE